MKAEKKVIKDFFYEFGNYNTVTIALSWILLGICFIFQFFVAIAGYETMIRATIRYDADFSTTFANALFVGPIMGYLRNLPYQTFSMNQKSTAIREILKYHPIDKKVIREVKIEKLVMFMFKVTVVSMVIQLLKCWVKGYEVSWFDLLCIFVFSFVWPVLVNAVAIYIEK